jgi:hypothetical protein
MIKLIDWKEFKKIISHKDLYLRVSLLSTITWWVAQAFSLLTIEPFYLRFFSISQMIADTLTLLVPILFILIVLGLLLVWLTKIINLTKWKSGIKFLYIFDLIFLIIAWFFIWAIIIRALVTPIGFTNQDNICEIISEDCNVKYFNDKYIFVERWEDSIEVLQFNKFFK